MTLSQAELHERFEYRNGELFYKISPVPKIKIGSKAGGVNCGYVKINIGKKKHQAHRLIFMMHHGYLPKEIDHINCNKLDNRIENLREVNRTQNRYNIGNYKNNTSGVKGVSVKNGGWQVSINIESKRKYIGFFKDFELAELVAMEARNKYHGEYANNGTGAVL